MIKPLEELYHIITILRSENGCPWDRKQTLQSLDPLFLEECYELSEAIHKNDLLNIQEELGDVTFMLLLMSCIASQDHAIDLRSVYLDAKNKLVYRHPHVFGDSKITNADEVIQNWELLKKEEKKDRDSIFDGIPKGLPPALRFDKLCRKLKTNKQNFAIKSTEFPEFAEVLDKILENGLSLNELLISINTHLESEARKKGL